MTAKRFSNSRRASRFVGKSDLEPSTSERSIRRIWSFSITSSRHRPTHTGFFLPLRNTLPFWYLRRANPPPRSPNRCPRPGRVAQLAVIEVPELDSKSAPRKLKKNRDGCQIRSKAGCSAREPFLTCIHDTPNLLSRGMVLRKQLPGRIFPA